MKPTLITVINGISFYKGNIIDNGVEKQQLILTDTENYRIDIGEDILRACNRIYRLWYV